MELSAHLHGWALLVLLRAQSFPGLPEGIRKRQLEFNWPDTLLQGKPVNLSQRASNTFLLCKQEEENV